MSAKEKLALIKERYGDGAADFSWGLVEAFAQGLAKRNPEGDPQEEKNLANIRVAQALKNLIAEGIMEFGSESTYPRYRNREGNFEDLKYGSMHMPLAAGLSVDIYELMNEFHSQFGISVDRRKFSFGLQEVLATLRTMVE